MISSFFDTFYFTERLSHLHLEHKNRWVNLILNYTTQSSTCLLEQSGIIKNSLFKKTKIFQ